MSTENRFIRKAVAVFLVLATLSMYVFAFEGIVSADDYEANDDEQDDYEDLDELSRDVFHEVAFIDWDGTVLETTTVKEGEDAMPPADPVRDGYVFLCWHGDMSCVTADCAVIATYLPEGVEANPVDFADMAGEKPKKAEKPEITQKVYLSPEITPEVLVKQRKAAKEGADNEQ